MDIVNLMIAPFAMCLILTGIHCYLGLHIVQRGVIFVDLSLAQVAAFGTAVAFLFGYEGCTVPAYLVSYAFAFIGAAIFALSRIKEKDVPQEAIIGITYAVFSAATILVLDKAPHGHEAMKSMLVGSVLYTTWPHVAHTFLIYLVIGIFHVVFRKRFLLISANPDEARRLGWQVPFWDFMFYVTLGFVVTSSVKVAGVLLVFSYLVVPAVCAILLVKTNPRRLLLGWGIGFLVSIFGLLFSALWDLPTGASVVAVFGVALLVSGIISFIRVKAAR
jgi:zinc/manganese transport system permease protein